MLGLSYFLFKARLAYGITHRWIPVATEHPGSMHPSVVMTLPGDAGTVGSGELQRLAVWGRGVWGAQEEARGGYGTGS